MESLKTDYKTETLTLCAPCSGRLCGLETLSDPVFREKLLGDGLAVEPDDPEDGDIVAPADGTILHVQNTAHALSMQTDGGYELLIHMGIDTVSMNGDGFHVYAKPGMRVHTGERLLHADLNRIRRRGCGTACIVLVTDGAEGRVFTPRIPDGTPVRAGKTPVMTVTAVKKP
ncbi:MAG: PTS glucose transporter subunit IIA [Clostridia bacterium]|nr:PTS glucose transporter subunit IIA [Clostridia bacterium]